jgi:carbonic anhydrase
MNTLFTTALGFAGGLTVAQVPPYHDRSKGTASVFVLSCIDPRFANDLAWFLTHNRELHGDYDLFTLAGASLGALQEDWRDVFYKHLELALELHGIEEVWCFDHLDCGMYKATLGLESDDVVNPHLDKMEDLKERLSIAFPQLKFRGYIFDQKGKVMLVNCDCDGCKLNQS